MNDELKDKFVKRIQGAICEYPYEEPSFEIQKRAYLYFILESLMKLPVPYPGTDQDEELVRQNNLIIDSIKNGSFEELLRTSCLIDEGVSQNEVSNPSDKDSWLKVLLNLYGKKIL